MRYNNWEDIARLLEDKRYPIYQIGFEMIVSRETIFDRIDAALVDLYVEQKKSIREIAQLLNVTHWCVREHLLDNNVQFRPRGGNNKRKGEQDGETVR